LASDIFATSSHRIKNITTRSDHTCSLRKDAPIRRDVCRRGRVVALRTLGGLHHQYVRAVNIARLRAQRGQGSASAPIKHEAC